MTGSVPVTEYFAPSAAGARRNIAGGGVGARGRDGGCVRRGAGGICSTCSYGAIIGTDAEPGLLVDGPV